LKYLLLSKFNGFTGTAGISPAASAKHEQRVNKV